MASGPVNFGVASASGGQLRRGARAVAMVDQPTGKRETKVLLIDSDRDHLDRLALELQGAGLRVVALSHFDVAPALYNIFHPDAAVIGNKALDISRVDLVPRLRHLSSGTLSLFCVLERADADAKLHFLEKLHGCDVLVKPVDARELIAKIKSSVRVKRSIEKIARAAGEQRSRVPSDQLTGAVSRGLLEAMIAQEARRAERHGGSFSVLVGALEAFAQYKRAFGAEWARGAMRHAASILRHGTRDCDVLARFGESQFAILLPGTGSEGVPSVRSRLSLNFQRLPFEFQGRWMKMPIAFGAASFPEVVGTAKLMLDAACEDLRRSKETRGRSRSALIA